MLVCVVLWRCVCVVACCIVSCGGVLRCVLFCYVVLRRVALCSAVLCRVAQCCIALCCSVASRSVVVLLVGGWRVEEVLAKIIQ